MKIPAYAAAPFLLLWMGCGCSPAPTAAHSNVVAVETFLADIAQNVAGGSLTVHALIPLGVEPHEFEPTPKDMAAVAESDLLIVNGGGLEGWLDQGLRSVGGSRVVVVASAGISPRTSVDSPAPPGSNPSAAVSSATAVDPHFWLDPVLVKTYVANILQGMIQFDPSGEADYRRNAETYNSRLDDLDRWIRSQVGQIPESQRMLITDHEDLGYFADRYGFSILGSIFPGVSPDAEPSASQVADLIRAIQSSGVKAVFLEAGANTQLADQISAETGVRIVSGLYTHSLTDSGGAAPTYLDMIRYDVSLIVGALK